MSWSSSCGDPGRTEAATHFATYDPLSGTRRQPARADLARASIEDAQALAVLQTAVRGGPVAPWAERIERVVSGARSAVVLARVEGETVGYGNVAFLPEHPLDGAPGGYYLTGVTVAPPWRRRGIGEALTRWRMAWTWERSDVSWCFASARNQTSLDLHQALGFTEVRRAPSIQGVGFDGGEGVLLSAQRPA
ncbi:GNAT family N-acetyltransferase [Streptomyces sp. 130]|nr:GNAT family N-acetyltransferase [Streptomyces sp. 130]